MNTAAVPESWEGQVVDGRFPLLERIGGSQRSDVFLTELPGQPSQRAVIKLIPADARDAGSSISRWETIAELSHPHLIRIFHMGLCKISSARLLYVVMEYAEENLSQILPSRALTPAEAEEMLRAVVDVLSFVHGKGFVHGHIKPSNVMAVGDQLKLSSDSLHLSGEQGDRLAEAGQYDAPEVGTGVVSPAADVWSLGMTLVAALTQHPPAWDKSAQKEPVVPDSIPEPFREIGRECLRLDPNQRCTLEQVKTRLQPVAASKGRTQSRTVLLVAAQIVLIALLAGLWLVTHRGSVEAPQKAAKPEAHVSSSAPLPPAPVAQAQTGVIHGAVTEQVLPNVPRSARNTIQGKIRVSVQLVVDAAGGVSSATLEKPGPSKYFAGLALASAGRWKFRAAQVDGKPVPSKWMLRFRFGRANTEVIPAETSP
jgi:TonB family protein